MSSCGSAARLVTDGVEADEQFADQVCHALRGVEGIVLDIAFLLLAQLGQYRRGPDEVGLSARFFEPG